MRLFTLFCLFVLLSFSCKKENNADACLNQFMELNNLRVHSNGDAIGCLMYYELFEWRNNQYFVAGNHCMDMVAIPVDCHNNELCEDYSSNFCNQFFREATNKGIVAYSNI